MEFSKTTIVVLVASLLLAVPLRGQDDRRGNPLRLTADPSVRPASPVEFHAEPIVSSEAFASAETLGSSPVDSFAARQVANTSEIPADIRQAVYPQQTTKQITVVPPQVHLDVANAGQLGSANYSQLPQLPQLPRPQTSVEPATHVEPATEKTLASLLAESDSAQQRIQSTRTQIGSPSSMVPASADSPFSYPPSTEARWNDSNLNAASETQFTDAPSLHQTLEKRSSSSDDFQALLQKIATSTCIVLVLGVGFVLIAKRWMNGGSTTSRTSANARNSAKTNAPTFRIVSQMRLSAKANLHLIEIGDQRVLVASDLGGIKSVVPLNTPFADALADYSEMMAGETNPLTNPAANQATTRTTNRDVNRSTEPQSTAGTYTPAARGAAAAKKSTAEIEIEMQRKLSELLGGEAFKDVFYKANQTTRAVA